MADGSMSGSHTALSLVWIAVGIVAGFVVWAYVQPMLPGKTA